MCGGGSDLWCQQWLRADDREGFKGANTEACEQLFSWITEYKRSLRHSSADRFAAWTIVICYLRNVVTLAAARRGEGSKAAVAWGKKGGSQGPGKQKEGNSFISVVNEQYRRGQGGRVRVKRMLALIRASGGVKEATADYVKSRAAEESHPGRRLDHRRRMRAQLVAQYEEVEREVARKWEELVCEVEGRCERT